MTTMTTADERPASPARRGSRAWLASLRVRVLVRYVVLLALATAGSILVARQVIVTQIDDRIDAALSQEVAELERLKGGDDPETGRPLGQRVRRIFDLYLERNVPAAGRGLPDLRQRGAVPAQRARGALPARPGPGARAPMGLDRAGRPRATSRPPAARSSSSPCRCGPRGRPGACSWSRSSASSRRGDLDTITGALAGVGVAVLLIGALLTWRGAQRVIAPMRDVTRTAHQITETDLSRRIPVQGEDEVADLARTFNEMLDRLESAFATQRRFLDDAGHELRTPITIVRGHLELMDDDPDERRETLALVMDELDRMGRLVNDVLTLAKAERPDFLDRETVDVEALSREVFAKATALARARTGTLAGVGRGVDRGRPAAADTGARAARAERRAAHGRRRRDRDLLDGRPRATARFSVRDDGPGRATGGPRASLRPLRPGRGPARARAQGLGLAIVRAIAEAHGGTVELHSRLGRGRNAHGRRAGRSASRRAGDRGGVSSVLIVEDEERIASFVEKGLRANGFATTVAGDGTRGLALASSGGFDLVILDLGLPDLDGLPCCARLRERARAACPSSCSRPATECATPWRASRAGPTTT